MIAWSNGGKWRRETFEIYTKGVRDHKNRVDNLTALLSKSCYAEKSKTSERSDGVCG
jgi:hypothetical protein